MQNQASLNRLLLCVPKYISGKSSGSRESLTFKAAADNKFCHEVQLRYVHADAHQLHNAGVIQHLENLSFAIEVLELPPFGQSAQLLNGTWSCPLSPVHLGKATTANLAVNAQVRKFDVGHAIHELGTKAVERLESGFFQFRHHFELALHALHLKGRGRRGRERHRTVLGVSGLKLWRISA